MPPVAKLQFHGMINDFDHNGVQDALSELGDGLGFEVETEVSIAKIDVLWKTKIANLDIVKYVFEVHRSGSIDGLILNLQKDNGDSAVQRPIAVSNKKS